MQWTNAFTRLVSLALLLACWQVAAALSGGTLLPGPVLVARMMLAEIASGTLPWHVGVTLARVLAGFTLSMIIGTAIGLMLGRMARVDRLFDGWLVLFLNLPALVVIILCYVWFGLTELAAILAVAINKIPNVAVMVREGARNLDRDLSEMALVYRLSLVSRLRHVILPQLAPALMAAARSGLALIWKIVLVVELLGRSEGVGFQIHMYFQLFDVAGILAYTLAFIVVILVVEALVMRPLDRQVARGRR